MILSSSKPPYPTYSYKSAGIVSGRILDLGPSPLPSMATCFLLPLLFFQPPLSVFALEFLFSSLTNELKLQIAFSVALQKAADNHQGRVAWEREKEGKEGGRKGEGGRWEGGRKGKEGEKGAF